MQVLTTAPAQVTAEHRQRERLKEEAEHASTVSETPPRKMTLVEQRVEEMRRQFGPRADGRLDADGREFMDRLLRFEKDNIDDGKIRLLKQTYLCDPTFTPEQVGLQSYAARSLCRWVLAMVSYHSVAKLFDRARAEIADTKKWAEFMQHLITGA